MPLKVVVWVKTHQMETLPVSQKCLLLKEVLSLEV